MNLTTTKIPLDAESVIIEGREFRVTRVPRASVLGEKFKMKQNKCVLTGGQRVRARKFQLMTEAERLEVLKEEIWRDKKKAAKDKHGITRWRAKDPLHAQILESLEPSPSELQKAHDDLNELLRLLDGLPHSL